MYRDHILVVDDDSTLLTQAEQILSEHYHISLASSGEQAVRYLKARQGADLILLDILMPDMDGYQTFEAIRGLSGCKYIPIIYLTSVTNPEAEIKGLNIGAADYVTKPFHTQILIARIENGLNAAGRLDAKKLEALPFPLTEKEYQMAKLLVRGYSNEEIGAETCASVETIKKRASCIYEKLGIENRKEISIYKK